jgi:hypothetical protein
VSFFTVYLNFVFCVSFFENGNMKNTVTEHKTSVIFFVPKYVMLSKNFKIRNSMPVTSYGSFKRNNYMS